MAPANGTITNSYATGNVTMIGPVGAAGGLVGTNGPGSVITDSQALGSVSAPANQTTTNFNFLSAGGLVGQNSGTIAGTVTPPTTTTACATGASWSCAGGAVNVGASAHVEIAGVTVGMNPFNLSNRAPPGASRATTFRK